jgi:hypothetical protein
MVIQKTVFGDTSKGCAGSPFDSKSSVRVNTCEHFNISNESTPIGELCREYGGIKLIQYENANGQMIVGDRSCG